MKNYRLLLLAASATLLAGCPTDTDDDPVPPEETFATFSVEVKNTSANQPLSPLAIIAIFSATSDRGCATSFLKI